MKIQFLGTAAAEGVPGLFCTCENCVKSRAIGGRALRTRPQAIIDDQLLIDFGPDTYAHILTYHIDLSKVSHCLITHKHSDHLYPNDLQMLRPRFTKLAKEYQLTFYGTEKVEEQILPILEANGALKDNISNFRKIEAFDCFMTGAYEVTALPAIHDPGSGPVCYQILKGDRRILYAHDTHYFHEDVWAFWKREKPYFNLVSLDCCNACLPLTYVGHMGLAENIQVRDRMVREGYADEKTIFVCNHFSHNGTNVVYDEFVPIAFKEGFVTSYDGMVFTI